MECRGFSSSSSSTSLALTKNQFLDIIYRSFITMLIPWLVYYHPQSIARRITLNLRRTFFKSLLKFFLPGEIPQDHSTISLSLCFFYWFSLLLQSSWGGEDVPLSTYYYINNPFLTFLVVRVGILLALQLTNQQLRLGRSLVCAQGTDKQDGKENQQWWAACTAPSIKVIIYRADGKERREIIN